MMRGVRFSRGFSTKRPYDVVVVGGGVVGSGAARALSLRGAKVLLIEQNTLTSGTTWHAAGLMGSLKGSPTFAEMIRRSWDIYDSYRDEEGDSTVGMHKCGSMGVARGHDAL